MAAQRLNQAIDGAPPRKVFCNRRCERAEIVSPEPEPTFSVM